MVYKIRNELQQLVSYAYPNETNSRLEQYKRFYLEFCSKVTKSKAGDYTPDKRRIRIFGVGLENPSRLLIVAIHELSHHIDFINRHSSDHSDEFYAIYKQLLFTALDRKIITIDDVYNYCSDGRTSDEKNVLNMLGNYRIDPAQLNSSDGQQKENKNGFVSINVFDCFKVKERIKMAGYKWNVFYKCWSKQVPVENKDKEIAYLLLYVSRNSIKIGELQWKS